MPIQDLDQFDRLCAGCGIALEYHDIAGQRHCPSVAVRQMLLAAMGHTVDDDAEVAAAIERVHRRQWRPGPPSVRVFRQSEPLQLDLVLDAERIGEAIGWQIVEESGRRHHGRVRFDAGARIDEAVFDDTRLLRFALALPALDEPGYHRLTLAIGEDDAWRSLLVVAPSACYQPPVFERDGKAWGLSLQLYTVRSRRNWGIGDFTDLKAIAAIFAPLGADLIGLNPLHALFAHLPENASPYSPSSRDFLNPIYLDIEGIDEFEHCESARKRVSGKAFQARLQRLRDADLVDYSEVWATKLRVLHLLYRQFCDSDPGPAAQRLADFEQFRREHGDELFRFALFEALQADFYRHNRAIVHWRDWPRAYRDPDSRQVADWAASNRDAIEFQIYLQWNTARQLAAAQRHCLRLGMGIGIYRDLAVGIEKASAQCWAEQPVYAAGVGIGAPADDFNPGGQNWDLPAPLPQALENRAYAPIVRTLRANMQHAGALRIDHIMGLMRLFWIPSGYPARRGTYVAYPFDDLLGILALESQRNRCLIIGEDLGTVPDEVRRALHANSILSYRIFRFEKDWQRGTMTPPQHYPRDALCTAGSHDLPTLAGYWRGTDLDLRDRLELYPSADSGRQQRELRARDRDAILAALAHEGLVGETGKADSGEAPAFDTELSFAIQRYLARSAAAVMMLQIEDLLAQEEQVNVPGTVAEYPNWRIKLALNLEDWSSQLDLEGIARVIKRERGRRIPGSG